MLSLSNTLPPHQGHKILYRGVDLSQANGAMILIHGRGSNAEDMAQLSDYLTLKNLAVIIPEATNNTWYPQRFIEERETNEPYLSSALALIASIEKALNQAGIPSNKLLLGGFSQGACLVSDYAANHQGRLAGVFGFSGGLIGKTLNPDLYSGSLDQTPVFLGGSNVDFHIPEHRVHESDQMLTARGAMVDTRIYPGMGHTINQDELDALQKAVDQF